MDESRLELHPRDLDDALAINAVLDLLETEDLEGCETIDAESLTANTQIRASVQRETVGVALVEVVRLGKLILGEKGLSRPVSSNQISFRISRS